MIKVSLRHCV